jgi:hypothetical protein
MFKLFKSTAKKIYLNKILVLPRTSRFINDPTLRAYGFLTNWQLNLFALSAFADQSVIALQRRRITFKTAI